MNFEKLYVISAGYLQEELSMDFADVFSWELLQQDYFYLDISIDNLVDLAVEIAEYSDKIEEIDDKDRIIFLKKEIKSMRRQIEVISFIRKELKELKDFNAEGVLIHNTQ